MSDGTDANSNAERVAQLAESDARYRRDAARELYIAGVALCEPALEEWSTRRRISGAARPFPRTNILGGAWRWASP